MDRHVEQGLRVGRFHFGARLFEPRTGTLTLHYRLGELPLVEEFRFPIIADGEDEYLAAALDLLHWIAGISYWKTACPDTLVFDESAPDVWQAEWLNRLYRGGLAEFAWVNELDSSTWPLFRSNVAVPARKAGPAGLEDRALVPIGGGKDSLVALERVRTAGVEAATVSVGRAPLLTRIAEHTGLPHFTVERRLDPTLAELNRAGAWNGHVPVTAINSAVVTVLALLTRSCWVVFANERSADQPTRLDGDGRPVNHQFSKSFEFECMLGDWVRRYIAADLDVFSILRRDREVAVCRDFADLSRYHDVFSSCNRNFHLDGARTGRWCGVCPKCHFVFLALAAFMPPAEMTRIFGRDLLDDPRQVAGFRALLDLEDDKPFECVGTGEESRALVARLAADPVRSGQPVIRALAPEARDPIAPGLDALLEPSGPHRIPDRFPCP